ncbi:MAG: hypothetical protein JW956_13775 [Calditrichaceae bacterium]|nr:hypothetical protein [Calditrichaceae bacterium]
MAVSEYGISIIIELIAISIHLNYAQSCFLNASELQVEKFDIIIERFSPPTGFQRIPADSNSFAFWLRQMPLLPEGSPVKDFKNRIFKKSTDSTVASVVAYDIKGRNLDQCMDILLRFRAEFLVDNHRKNEIQFPLPDGLMLGWVDWAEGIRPEFKGAHFYLEKTAEPDSSDRSFKRYLNTIFEYSSTQAFYHYYKNINPDSLQIGDFVVKKGSKGHAVMIVDLACDKNGNFVALIGQGDTPACQFYLLNYKMGNSWFPIDTAKEILPLPIKKEMRWKGLRRF